tara:strand:+ start:3412 stop:4164 length:753 start_codon:yes stop_codon:yes gene_type:complete
MISANRLARDKNPKFHPSTWMLDSGAFTQIARHGDFTISIEQYARLIKRYENHGDLTCAVAQDYMCEPDQLAITGKTVRQHQRMTTKRYFHLLKEMREIGCKAELMPVLQGWEAEDYLQHLDMYEKAWAHRKALAGYTYRFDSRWQSPEVPKYIGLGTMCKRNGKPEQIETILELVLPRLQGYKVHLFGVKKTALKLASIRDQVWSADSMAYDFAARYTQKVRTRIDRMKSAKKFEKEMDTQSVQLCLSF